MRVFARGEVEMRGDSEEGEGGMREKRDERDERVITGHLDERGLVSDFILTCGQRFRSDEVLTHRITRKR